MELEKLEKERFAYASKIIVMAIHIAFIFIIPAAVALCVYFFWKVPVGYTLPVSFIISWVWVYFIYKKISYKARELDRRIRELKNKEESLTRDSQ